MLTSWSSKRKRKKNDELKKEKSALEKSIAALRVANDSMRQVAEETSLSASKKTLVDKAANAKYSIGLYGLDIDKKKYRSVERALEEDGYTIVQGTLLNAPPAWLARRSTVFYYDHQAMGKAKALAERIGKVTGRNPDIQRGGGLGVVPGQEEWTFFIHIIGS